MVLIATDRLLRLTRVKASGGIILRELELLEKRVQEAIVAVELAKDWQPGESAVPE